MIRAGLIILDMAMGVSLMGAQVVEAKVTYDVFDFKAHRSGRNVYLENTFARVLPVQIVENVLLLRFFFVAGFTHEYKSGIYRKFCFFEWSG